MQRFFLLDVIKLEIEKNDVSANGMLDKLIRDNLINATMATSLMNDSGYAYEVARNLVEMGGSLFGTHDIYLKMAANSLALDDEELNELAKQQAS